MPVNRESMGKAGDMEGDTETETEQKQTEGATERETRGKAKDLKGPLTPRLHSNKCVCFEVPLHTVPESHAL